MPKIEILDDEVVYEGDFLKCIKRRFRMQNGKTGIWEIAKRKRHTGIVAVCALTPQKEIILEKIFRIPLGTYVIELPAGIMDKPNETPEDAVRRELLEETGYEARHVELLLVGPLNPGLTPDRMMIYLARDVHRVAEPSPEPTEDIEVITVPLENLVDFVLENQEQVDVDLKILSVLAALEKKGLV